MLISMIYLLVGIAVISTIIELMRRQYNEAWRKMQELRAQIQAQLQLAATLKQVIDSLQLSLNTVLQVPCIYLIDKFSSNAHTRTALGCVD